MRSTILRPVRSRVMWLAEMAKALASATVFRSSLRGGRAMMIGDATRKPMAV